MKTMEEGIKEDMKDVQYSYPFDTPRDAYADLIYKISGKGTWERNPYVWVYEFKLIK